LKGEIVILSKTQQKIRKTKDNDSLTPQEEAVVKRILAGKEKIYHFNNAEEAIKFLHKSVAKKK
jgi:hypothetical protein